MHALSGWDCLAVGLYFTGLAAVVWWSARRQKTTEDYFLAGRNIGWFAVGASLFASNIGSEHLVGLAGAGAKSGVAMAHYELHAWCLLVLGWVLVPFYYRARVFTMPEFLERRYNPACRWMLSLVSLLSYVFTKVSVTVFAGGMVCRTLLPDLSIGGLDSFWTGAMSTVVLTGIYTLFGGLRAVVYTDALQAVVLIAGSLCITFIGLQHLGGWSELRAQCGSTFFNLWRPASDPEFPWPGMLFAAPIVGLWYWCTDQYIVNPDAGGAQLELRAARHDLRGLPQADAGVHLHRAGHDRLRPGPQNLLVMSTPDQAYPALVQQLLPSGLRGLVVAGLLAALMSSLSSLFNSCSTLFTVDIYEKIKPGASERELVAVGRIATGVVVLLGLAWIPVMKMVSGALYEYLQSVQAYLAPPMTAVFFLGVFWPRLNGKGAMAALCVGFLLGLSKLACQIYAGMLPAEAAPGGLAAILVHYGQINFLVFCVYLFLASCLVLAARQPADAAPAREKSAATYATVTADERSEIRGNWNRWDVINAILILLLIISVYLYFTG